MTQQTPEKSRSWVGVIIFALGIGVVMGIYTIDYRIGLIFGFFRRALGCDRTLRASIWREEIGS